MSPSSGVDLLSSDSRLGPLAAAAGTSSRMLIHRFGTRDGLRREVLGQARQPRAWSAISGPQGTPYLRMLPA
jgi:hypothetical protein